MRHDIKKMQTNLVFSIGQADRILLSFPKDLGALHLINFFSKQTQFHASGLGAFTRCHSSVFNFSSRRQLEGAVCTISAFISKILPNKSLPLTFRHTKMKVFILEGTNPLKHFRVHFSTCRHYVLYVKFLSVHRCNYFMKVFSILPSGNCNESYF
jgi:hypothetical protein